MPALLAATGAKTGGFGRRVANRGTKRTSPSGGEYRRAGFHPRRAAGGRGAAGGRRLGVHGAAHARARAGSSVLRAGGHEDPVLRRPRDGLEHQRGGAARRQHGRLHPLAAAADGAQRRACIFPGHGGQVEEPQRLVKAYLLHRRMREQAILECIRGGNNTVRAHRAGRSTRASTPSSSTLRLFLCSPTLST